MAWIITLFLCAPAMADDREPRSLASSPSDVPVDCGTASLYYLARLQGRGVTLQVVCAAMPGGFGRPHSMKEIREAARTLGLSLQGVQLPPHGRLPDQPSLVYLNRALHGHFAVVRPVGHSGTLVQVLDPSAEPDVLDASRLRASSEWTGLALVPQTRALRWIGLALGSAVLLAAVGVVRGWRGGWRGGRLDERGAAAGAPWAN